MKRGAPRRHRELRADPEKVREFMRKSRKPLKRTGELARSSLKRPKPKPRSEREGVAEGPLTPSEWRRAAFVASGGRCIITGDVARDAEDHRYEVHHPLDKGELRARGLFDRVWDPRNALWVRQDVHERHTSGFRRIPRDALPACVWEFCRELDELAGTEWATARVQRFHPARVAGDTHTP